MSQSLQFGPMQLLRPEQQILFNANEFCGTEAAMPPLPWVIFYDGVLYCLKESVTEVETHSRIPAVRHVLETIETWAQSTLP